MSGFQVPPPVNEPVLGYAPGSAERKALKAALGELKSRELEIPLHIGGEEVRTGRLGDCRAPHDHTLRLGRWHEAGPRQTQAAVRAALKARKDWSRTSFHERAAVFLKAAELLAGPWRAKLNAACMLAQSKNAYQAEIDVACELIDFWRFNARFAEQVYAMQPESARGVWNRLEHRPLEGFVFAVTPFNFASIAGNLPTAPALMGNTVVWKPASSAVYVAHLIYELLREAGLPDGVINMAAGSPADVGAPVFEHPDFAGLHFTGSTASFRSIWGAIASNLGRYRTYPRIVGETGGKGFVFAHASADPDALAAALVRGAFEYQGQKCSAASRAYIPKSLWRGLKERLEADLKTIRMGGVEDFRNFVNAVIDRPAYDRLSRAIEGARKDRREKVLFGGACDDAQGYFIEPTVIEAKDPQAPTMVEELFGPVLTVYVYADERFEETLKLCDKTSPYSLTGAVFARDRAAQRRASDALVAAAGNFYLNDKPTGAVVGQQPFGGARASGTNDKAGSPLNLLRWVSPRTIKENFAPPKDYRYPFMAEA